MAGTGDKMDIDRCFQCCHVMMAVNTAIQCIDNIDLILSQHLEHIIRAGGDQLQADSRIAVVEVFEVAVELPAGERFCDCDPDNACRRSIACNMTGFCPKPQDLMRKRKQLLSFVRQCNRMTDPFKQRNPQFVFELLDLKGNGGLCKAQPLCSLCKAFQFVDHDKCFQIFNIH